MKKRNSNLGNLLKGDGNKMAEFKVNVRDKYGLIVVSETFNTPSKSLSYAKKYLLPGYSVSSIEIQKVGEY